jgi:hypothetical protein
MVRKLTALGILITSFACAQGERGTLNGTVADASGAVVPAAAVVATETTTGVETRAATTSAGIYQIPSLPSGQYKLSVSKPGFRTSVVENITLRVAQTLTVDVRMELGQVSEAVNVTSESPLVETSSSETGRYVSKREFDTWPVQVSDGQRQIQTFIFSSLPGTVGDTFQGSINGGQAYTHEILIEGMSIGRFDLQGGSNNELSPSADAVSEFKMQTGVIGAQYGGGDTAVANFAIKSGTNELHGSAFTYVQNDVLQANSFTNNALGTAKPPYKLLNYGYNVGGPVVIPKVYNGKNKTFWFTNLEHTRVRQFTSASRITLPLPAFKQGNFSSLLNPAFTGDPNSGRVIGSDALGRPVVYGQIYDPRTARSVGGQTVLDPFPGNIIPQSSFDPVSANILNLAPITDPIADSLLNNYPSIGTCCPIFDQTTWGIKIDHIFNERHHLSGYFNRELRTRNNSPTGRWGTPPGSPTDVYQLQQTPGVLVRVAEDWTISPSILNHFAIGYNRFGNLNSSVYLNQGWPEKIGLQNVPQTTFPRLNFTGKAAFGGGIGAGGQLGSNSAGEGYNGSTIVMDNLTIVHGKHSFKTGFESRFYYYNNRNYSGTGAFTFTPVQTALPGFDTETGQAFASFLLGAVSQTNRAVNVANPGYRTRQPAFYFSDDWKVTPKLTFNLGLRWEIIGGIYEVAGRMSNIDLNASNPGANGRPGALVFADEMNRTTFQDTNWKQFSPRVGFAYAATEKLVFRGGYGINNTVATTNFNSPSTFGYNGTISLSPTNSVLPYPQAPVSYLSTPYPSFSSVLPNHNPALANGQDFTYLAADSSKLGYVQNFNFGVSYQFPAQFVLDVSYIGNKGTRLVSYGLDALNQLPIAGLQYGDALLDPLSSHPELSGLTPYAGFDGTVGQALRPFPQYQNIGQYNPNFGMSTYHSLQITGTRHFTKGLAVLAAYTWSKMLTDVASPLDSIPAQDVANHRLEKSLSDLNVPQSFKLTWIYELPVGPGKKYNPGGVLGQVIGGWRVSAIQSYSSGDSLALSTDQVSSAFSGLGINVRPDVVSGASQVLYNGNGLDFVNGTPYLNTAAFLDVQTTSNGVPLRLGTAPRRLDIRGPAHFNEDVGAEKSFPFSEKRNITFRADFANLVNRHGLSNPDTDVSSPTFGRIFGTWNSPRAIQLSLRVNF